MAKADPGRRVTRALQELQTVPEPLVRLAAVRQAREQFEHLELATVRAARESGATWTDVGAIYGLTKQGAQQRFGSAVRTPSGTARR
jgi:hypothetical protein